MGVVDFLDLTDLQPVTGTGKIHTTFSHEFCTIQPPCVLSPVIFFLSLIFRNDL